MLNKPRDSLSNLRPTLAAKQYGAEDLLSRLVAEAVMAVMPSNPKTAEVR
jgi:T-complex protein 1 subunit theta